MHWYKLITNDGEFFITSHPSVMQYARYATAKVKSGTPVSDVIFRCIPQHPTSVETIVQAVEKTVGLSPLPDVLAKFAHK